ncbi:MAG: threonine--tRNA ligase, partial [Elusimicrobia bacterium]|nr:threonine--tRNA ligase [Elusimicrobiota bacterium]
MEKDLQTLRHSTSHLMAAAVLELFPGTKVAIGPSIEEGFYYDFDRKEPFTVDDLAKIEEKMHELAKKDDPFICTTVNKADAIKLFEEKGEKYKK